MNLGSAAANCETEGKSVNLANPSFRHLKRKDYDDANLMRWHSKALHTAWHKPLCTAHQRVAPRSSSWMSGAKGCSPLFQQLSITSHHSWGWIREMLGVISEAKLKIIQVIEILCRSMKKIKNISQVQRRTIFVKLTDLPALFLSSS